MANRLHRFRVVLNMGLQFSTVYVLAATPAAADDAAEKFAGRGLACLSELAINQNGPVDCFDGKATAFDSIAIA
jgi:hypothetical protein